MKGVLSMSTGMTCIDFNVVPPDKSEYLKLYKPYIRVSSENEDESIFLVVLKNADGDWSKYFAALKVADSGKIGRVNTLLELKAFIRELYNVHFSQELKSGYEIGEIILYKGRI